MQREIPPKPVINWGSPGSGDAGSGSNLIYQGGLNNDYIFYSPFEATRSVTTCSTTPTTTVFNAAQLLRVSE